MSESAHTMSASNWPIRQKSAHGLPKETSQFARRCVVCQASFLGLAPGRTGERGLWGGPTGWSWFCSTERAGQGGT